MAELMRSTGSSRIDPGVAIVVLTGLALLLGLLVPGYRRERMRDNITRCADNLSAMGKAMAVYADDYGGALPVAGA
jgi:hypothetical protein